MGLSGHDPHGSHKLAKPVGLRPIYQDPILGSGASASKLANCHQLPLHFAPSLRQHGPHAIRNAPQAVKSCDIAGTGLLLYRR